MLFGHILIAAIICCSATYCLSFQKPKAVIIDRKHPASFDGERRNFFLIASSAAVSLLLPTSASGLDFNPDGSLKDASSVSGAKFRPIEKSFEGSSAQYEVPEKWGGSNSEGKVTVYRVQGEVQPDRLEKATRTGVGKALDFKALEPADLISGRTQIRDGKKYYEFDMAVAPASCDQTEDDLRLGFCSYDTIYLLSATVFDKNLYVLAIESDKQQWKRSNSDLKLVRSSFAVSSS